MTHGDDPDHGATLANHCGLTSFDIPALSDFLDDALQRQRGEMKAQEYATMTKVADVGGVLQDMVSDARGNGNAIITETIPPVVMGKPRPVNLVDTDLARLRDVWMQVGDKDRRLRIKVRQFNEWLREHRLNPRDTLVRLGGLYSIAQSKQTIGAGVPGMLNIARSECYDFKPLPTPSPGSDEPS